MIGLINDATTELGKYNSKYESAKTDSVSGTKWYTISDSYSGIEVNKIENVYFLDDNDEYIIMPRLVRGMTPKEDFS